jgi:hypothetical protein
VNGKIADEACLAAGQHTKTFDAVLDGFEWHALLPASSPVLTVGQI